MRKLNTNAGPAVFNFNGGTLEHSLAGGNSQANNLMMDIDDVNFLSGGAIIDTAGNSAWLTNTLDGPGGLTKKGDGTLQLATSSSTVGVSNTFDGPVNVEGGTLIFAHPEGLGDNNNTVTVFSNATLFGNQSISGGTFCSIR